MLMSEAAVGDKVGPTASQSDSDSDLFPSQPAGELLMSSFPPHSMRLHSAGTASAACPPLSAAAPAPASRAAPRRSAPAASCPRPRHTRPSRPSAPPRPSRLATPARLGQGARPPCLRPSRARGERLAQQRRGARFGSCARRGAGHRVALEAVHDGGVARLAHRVRVLQPRRERHQHEEVLVPRRRDAVVAQRRHADVEERPRRPPRVCRAEPRTRGVRGRRDSDGDRRLGRR